jgi:inorganic triphosphatase YgiF
MMATAKDCKDIPLEQLRPNVWNANEMSEGDFRRLVKEIQEVGFIEFPQVVPMDDGTFIIIGGEHRVSACRELEYETVPCIVLGDKQWTEQDLQKLVSVRLNVLSGKLDPARMAALYDEFAVKYSKDALQELFAFTDKGAWNKMLNDIGRGLKKAGVDKDGSFAEKAKEARTVKDLTDIINEMFASYGDTVSQNYMVFTYGKKDHVYIAMNKDTHRALRKVLKHAGQTGKDINDLVGVAVVELAKAVEVKGKNTANVKQDDTLF